MSRPSPPAKVASKSAIPEEVLAILGTPPIISGESEDDYFALLGRMGQAAGATDAIDWLMVEQACALAWTLRRLRIAKEKLIEHRRDSKMKRMADKAWAEKVYKATTDALAADDNMPKAEKEELLEAYLEHDDYRTGSADKQGLIEHMAALLEIDERRDPVDEDLALAMVIDDASENLKSLDALIEKAEDRFEKTLREIDRRHLHRAKLKAIVDDRDIDPAPAMRVVASN